MASVLWSKNGPYEYRGFKGTMVRGNGEYRYHLVADIGGFKDIKANPLSVLQETFEELVDKEIAKHG